MRILNLVAGEKWTGPAAVVFDQTAALVASGMEAQFALVAGSLLAERLLPLGWARPLITHPRTPGNVLADARRLRETVLREKFDILHSHTTHDHGVALLAARGTDARVVRTLHHIRYARPGPGHPRALPGKPGRSRSPTGRSPSVRRGRAGPSPVVATETISPRRRA